VTLRAKTLLIVGGSLLGAVALLSALAYSLILSRTAETERILFQRDLEKFSGVFDRDFEALQQAASSLASVYAHLSNTGGVWPNLPPPPPCDAAFILDPTGVISASLSRTEVASDLADITSVATAFATHTIPGNDQKRTHGFARLASSKEMVALASISTPGSGYSLPATIVAARLVSDAYLKQMAGRMMLPLEVELLDDPNLPPHFSAAREELQRLGTDRLMREAGPDRLEVYRITCDYLGQPQAIAHTWFSRQISRDGRRAAVFIAVAMLGVGILATAAALYTLEKFVLRRIARLARAVKEIAHTRDFSKRVPAFGGDELFDFATTLNAMLTALSDASKELKHKEQIAAAERERSDKLLLNILPDSIAARLKDGPGDLIADQFPETTILFADIVDFTQLSLSKGARELVEMLNGVFSQFDRIAAKHGIQRIKTIGDAYMAASGLPDARTDHAEAVADMALDMVHCMSTHSCPLAGADNKFRMRLGMHSGPVIAGVIGMSRFAYDLWGVTVNMASRMESTGEPGRIHTTEAVYLKLRDRYHFEDRGITPIKGTPPTHTYFLVGKK